MNSDIRYSCHVGDTFVFKVGETEIYGGGLIRDSTGEGMDLIIELHDIDVPVSTRGFGCLKLASWGRDYLYLPIPDGSVPDWNRDFWVALFEEIQMFRKVLVRCLGGHGRTGTVLAILAGLSDIDYPCKFIRKNYCNKAIETESQKRYIRDITGCSGNCDKCIEVRGIRKFVRKSGIVYGGVWNGEWDGELDV